MRAFDGVASSEFPPPCWAPNLKSTLSSLSATTQEGAEEKRRGLVAKAAPYPAVQLLRPRGPEQFPARFLGTFIEPIPSRGEKIARA